jgi:hypothetical protein
MNNAVKKGYNSFDPVGYNWHNGFFRRHSGVKTKFSKLMEKVRVLNENADTYIEYFERYDRLCTKWGIDRVEECYNMDEVGAAIGLYHKSRVIVPAEEAEVIAIV